MYYSYSAVLLQLHCPISTELTAASKAAAENLSFGEGDARKHVTQLLIDDGVPRLRRRLADHGGRVLSTSSRTKGNGVLGHVFGWLGKSIFRLGRTARSPACAARPCG